MSLELRAWQTTWVHDFPGELYKADKRIFGNQGKKGFHGSTSLEELVLQEMSGGYFTHLVWDKPWRSSHFWTPYIISATRSLSWDRVDTAGMAGQYCFTQFLGSSQKPAFNLVAVCSTFPSSGVRLFVSQTPLSCSSKNQRMANTYPSLKGKYSEDTEMYFSSRPRLTWSVTDVFGFETQLCLH